MEPKVAHEEDPRERIRGEFSQNIIERKYIIDCVTQYMFRL